MELQPRKCKRGHKCKSCFSCHEDDEKDVGNLIVSGKRLEPTPIPGKNGVLNLVVQAAHDNDYLYFHFKWKTHMNREGRMHNMMRFDGKKWKFYGSHRAKGLVKSGKEPPLYEDRLAIMLDDGKVKKKSDIRKYLPASRSDDMASWNKVKPVKEIAKLKDEGMFFDLMQWRVARSNAVGMADDGYVLEYRNFDKGKKMFSWNVDKKTMIPKYMFDPVKVGYKALREDQLSDQTKATAIIKEVNAKP